MNLVGLEIGIAAEFSSVLQRVGWGGLGEVGVGQGTGSGRGYKKWSYTKAKVKKSRKRELFCCSLRCDAMRCVHCWAIWV